MSGEMQPIRCPNCGRTEDEGVEVYYEGLGLEIRCPSCGYGYEDEGIDDEEYDWEDEA